MVAENSSYLRYYWINLERSADPQVRRERERLAEASKPYPSKRRFASWVRQHQDLAEKLGENPCSPNSENRLDMFGKLHKLIQHTPVKIQVEAASLIR